MSYLIWISRLSVLACLAWIIASEQHPVQAQATPSPSVPSQSNPLIQRNSDGSATIDLSPAALAEFQKSQGDFAKAAYFTRWDAANYYNARNWQQTIERLNDALELSRKAKEPIEEAETLTYLAIVHNRLATESNQPQKRQTALDYYYQALIQWQKINYRPRQEQDISRFGTGLSNAAADELNQISVLYSRLGQPKEALDYQIQALLTGAKVPPVSNDAERLLLMGYLYNDLKQPQQAVEVFNKALSILEAKENKWGQSETLFFMGMVSYLSLNQPQQALDYFNRAQTLWESLNSPKVAEALFGKAWIARKTGKNTEAIQLMDQAVAAFQKAGDRQGELKTSMFKGFLYQADGKTAEAIATYKETIGAIESLRDSIKLEDLKSKFADKQVDLYTNLIDLLQQSGRYEEAFEYVERAKARSFLDQISKGRINLRAGASPDLIKREKELNSAIAFSRQQLTKLRQASGDQQDRQKIASITTQLQADESRYSALLRDLQINNPEAASLRTITIAPLAEIQRLLDADTTLVEYYVMPSQVLAFIVTRDSFRTVPLNVNQEELTKMVSGLLQQQEIGTTVDLTAKAPDTWSTSRGEIRLVRAMKADGLQTLHNWLVEPLRPHLKTRKIGIVPHAALHYVPFAALTRDGSRYLGDDYALFNLPSASVLPFIQQKRKPNATNLLVLGNPTPTEPLPSLGSAEQEAKDIAALYNTQPLLGKEATEQAVWGRSGKAGILHLAAHGIYNANNPLFSTLFLAGNNQAEDSHSDGRLEVREVYELDLQATNLVILSACQTQLGNLSSGDEVVGLSRAFLYAGTPSVVASLWSVDDGATGLLMQQFYKHLKAGMEKAEALQAAQREVRANPRYASPFYWAAFTLTGDSGR